MLDPHPIADGDLTIDARRRRASEGPSTELVVLGRTEDLAAACVEATQLARQEAGASVPTRAKHATHIQEWPAGKARVFPAILRAAAKSPHDGEDEERSNGETALHDVPRLG